MAYLMKSDNEKAAVVFNSKREVNAARWLKERYPDAEFMWRDINYTTIKRNLPGYTVVKTVRHGPLDHWTFAIPIPGEPYNWKTFVY